MSTRSLHFEDIGSSAHVTVLSVELARPEVGWRQHIPIMSWLRLIFCLCRQLPSLGQDLDCLRYSNSKKERKIRRLKMLPLLLTTITISHSTQHDVSNVRVSAETKQKKTSQDISCLPLLTSHIRDICFHFEWKEVNDTKTRGISLLRKCFLYVLAFTTSIVLFSLFFYSLVDAMCVNFITSNLAMRKIMWVEKCE